LRRLGLQQHGPDLPSVEGRFDARPVIGRIGAAKQAVLTAEIKGARIARVHGQGADMTLDKHPVRRTDKRNAAIRAAPQSLSDRTHVKAMRSCHGWLLLAGGAAAPPVGGCEFLR